MKYNGGFLWFALYSMKITGSIILYSLASFEGFILYFCGHIFLYVSMAHNKYYNCGADILKCLKDNKITPIWLIYA